MSFSFPEDLPHPGIKPRSPALWADALPPKLPGKSFPGIRKWQPTPVCLPGESHGWRSLSVYSPWGRKESDTTERLIRSDLIFHQEAFSSSSLSAIRVLSSAYLKLLLFLPANLILACASSSPAFLMMYSAYKLNKQPTAGSLQSWDRRVRPRLV